MSNKEVTKMKIENHKIVSIHNTLAEAVEAAGIDLSYNPGLAKRDIGTTDQNVSKAYVMEDGTVQYIFNCDIKLLNKFTPFHSSLSSSPFQLVTIKEDNMEIMVSHQNWPKCRETRQHAKRFKMILTSN